MESILKNLVLKLPILAILGALFFFYQISTFQTSSVTLEAKLLHEQFSEKHVKEIKKNVTLMIKDFHV